MSSWRAAVTLVLGLAAAACLLFVPGLQASRGAAIAVVCLGLWLLELVPTFVPTLLLLAVTPVALGEGFTMREVLGWSADPVLLLFFGGFVFGEAARAHGIDRRLAANAVGAARGNARALVALFALSTAFMSMWMSNIAAAALMIAALRPMPDLDERVRRALLLAVAFGANLGGMATPIGSGPNAIAIAAMPAAHPVTFVVWMAFAVPLTLCSLAIAVALVIVRHGVRGAVPVSVPSATADGHRPLVVAGIGLVAVIAWLSEPLHGVGAPTVALGLAVVLFGTGLVPAERLRRLDWGTLVLIAGGLALGHLLEETGILALLAPHLATPGASPLVFLGVLLTASALLAAVMSNTATATLLIPLAMAARPGDPTLPILVALASSFGMPFVVSTPPNAMVAGEGVSSADLLVPGMVLLVGGVAALTLTGGAVLDWFVG